MKWVMDICGVNVECFSWCQVTHEYLWGLRSLLWISTGFNFKIPICLMSFFV